MNYKQKLGYILLGAGIMAVGITIGQFITPNIEAQNNGVFDKIICRSLSVVDETGKVKCLLSVDEDGSGVHIYGKDGNQVISLGADEHVNGISLYDKAGKSAISLNAGKDRNSVMIYNKAGKKEIILGADKDSNSVMVGDSAGNMAFALRTSKTDNDILIKGKVGEERLTVFTNEKLGVGIAIFDRAGKITWHAP